MNRCITRPLTLPELPQRYQKEVGAVPARLYLEGKQELARSTKAEVGVQGR